MEPASTYGNSRLTEHVFLLGRRLNKGNWSREIYTIFQEIDSQEYFHNNATVSLNWAWGILHQNYVINWTHEIGIKPKLRTYVKFKSLYETESYVASGMSFKFRSVLARLRSGILPLEIEIGRYHGLPVHERLCKICRTNTVEDESHFLFECVAYSTQREIYFNKIINVEAGFLSMDLDSKFHVIMSKSCVGETAKYVYNIYTTRQQILYNDIDV